MNMQRFLSLFGLILLFAPFGYSQILTGLATKWSDEFSEWTVFTDEEDFTGDMVMRWQMQGDYSEWDYRFEEEIGSIRLKWEKQSK